MSAAEGPDLRSFSYRFNYGSRCEQLSFRTYGPVVSAREPAELFTLFGDSETMKAYCGSDAIIQEEAQAEKMVTAYRVRNSLTTGKKCVRWKLYYTYDAFSNSAEEVFIGLVGATLVEPSQLLEPMICLNSAYQKRRFGEKALFCLMIKLMSHASWFHETFRGLFIEINPNNTRCISLKNKILSENDVQQRNPERDDGVWVVRRRWKFDGKIRLERMRHFVCHDLTFLKSLLKDKTTQRINTKDLALLAYDNEGRRPIRVRSPSEIGIPLYPTDIMRLSTALSSLSDTDDSHETPETVVNRFKLTLPEDLLLSFSFGAPSQFYLLAFMKSGSSELIEFEVIDEKSKRITLHQYLAFIALPRPSEAIAIRLVKGELDGVNGFLLELAVDVFNSVRSIDECIRKRWVTTRFNYYRNKRRSKFSNYISELVFYFAN